MCILRFVKGAFEKALRMKSLKHRIYIKRQETILATEPSHIYTHKIEIYLRVHPTD